MASRSPSHSSWVSGGEAGLDQYVTDVAAPRVASLPPTLAVAFLGFVTKRGVLADAAAQSRYPSHPANAGEIAAKRAGSRQVAKHPYRLRRYSGTLMRRVWP